MDHSTRGEHRMCFRRVCRGGRVVEERGGGVVIARCFELGCISGSPHTPADGRPPLPGQRPILLENSILQLRDPAAMSSTYLHECQSNATQSRIDRFDRHRLLPSRPPPLISSAARACEDEVRRSRLGGGVGRLRANPRLRGLGGWWPLLVGSPWWQFRPPSRALRRRRPAPPACRALPRPATPRLRYTQPVCREAAVFASLLCVFFLFRIPAFAPSFSPPLPSPRAPARAPPPFLPWRPLLRA